MSSASMVSSTASPSSVVSSTASSSITTIVSTKTKATCYEMVKKAFEELSAQNKSRKGVSVVSLKNYVRNAYGVDLKKRKMLFRRVLLKMVNDGAVVQTVGKGLLGGSYKLQRTPSKAAKIPKPKPMLKPKARTTSKMATLKTAARKTPIKTASKKPVVDTNNNPGTNKPVSKSIGIQVQDEEDTGTKENEAESK